MTRPIIVWLRQDLRIADNAALRAAAGSGHPVLPLYIHDALPADRWSPGAASRWWLHHSLAALSRAFVKQGTRLLLRRGPAVHPFRKLIAELHPIAVFWNASTDPRYTAVDEELQRTLTAASVDVCMFRANRLYAPGQIQTKAGTLHRVFTPFWKACLAADEPAAPLPAPKRIRGLQHGPAPDVLDAWELTRGAERLDSTLGTLWMPGEAGARQKLRTFLRARLETYSAARDFPAHAATSQLSPHLHWGEITPRQMWHTVVGYVANAETARDEEDALAFLREIAWGEFAAQWLAHTPTLPDEPLRREFRRFPWRRNAKRLAAWQQGQTGYPLVDAGMRELWATGWMHNRVRMVAASFLVKHLRIAWQQGEAWFWDTLVDADLANNAMNWQWVAGCGVDAAPFFRIFNPVRQGETFDPQGAYIRRWIPELAQLPDRFLHRPWEAPAEVLRRAGVTLGRMYPRPIVGHREAREDALDAYASITGGGLDRS